MGEAKRTVAAVITGVAFVAVGIATGGLSFALTPALIGTFAAGAVIGSLAASAIPTFDNFTASDIQGRTIATRDPIAAQKIVYGTVKTSGTIIFLEATGENNKYLHQVTTLAGHEINGILNVWLGDDIESGELSNSVITNANNTLQNLVYMTAHFGADNQVADSSLVSLTEWTEDHKLQGIAYIYTRFEYDQDKYVSGVPNVAALVQGKKVYDPRNGLTSFSSNAALCILDYLRNSVYGLGALDNEINMLSFKAAANICDENVITSSGTEKRYTINGVVNTADKPSTILREMVAACAGTVYYSNGQWHIKAGAYITPTKVLTRDDFVSGIKITTRVSNQSNFNSVKGVFVSPNDNWQPVDFPPVSDSVFIAEDNNIERALDIKLPFTTSEYTAQRLAKLALYRNREQITIEVECKLTSFSFDIGDTLMISDERLGWDNKVFEVLSWTYNNNIQPSIAMSLKETSIFVYDWDSGDASELTRNNTNLPNVRVLTAVENLTVSLGGQLQRDGTFINVAEVSWDFKEGLISHYEVEWRPVNGSVYSSLTTTENSVLLLPIIDGIQYTVRVRAVNTFGVRSSWISEQFTGGGDSLAPSAPTGLTATGRYGSIYLTWTNPPDKDLNKINIYENAENNPSTALFIAETYGTSFLRENLSFSESFYYWVTAVDHSGNESGKSAVAYATTTQITYTDISNISIDYQDLSGTLQNYVNNIDSIDVNVATLTNDVITIASDFTTLTNDVITIASDFTTLTNDVSAIESDITTLTTSVSTIESDITTLTANVSTIESNFITLTTDVSAIESNVTTLTANVSTIESNFTTLTTDVETNTTSISTIESDITTLTTDVGTNTTSISAIESDITILATDVSTIESNFTTLTNNVSTIASNITTLTTSVGTNTTSISTIQASVDGIAGYYGVEIDANGVVAGFQLLNLETRQTAFNIKADQFNLYSSDGNNDYTPFAVYTTTHTVNGITVPAGAYIENVFITGDLIVNNTITAEKIDTRGLSIKDNNGNTILAAGSALSPSYVSGLNSSLAGAVPAYNNNEGFSTITLADDGSIRLYSATDNVLGMVFPAFRVNNTNGEKWKINIAIKASAQSDGGVNVRIQEYDDIMPAGKTHISYKEGPDNPDIVQTATRQILLGYEDKDAETYWQTLTLTYTPRSTAKYASVLVLNKKDLSNNGLYVRPPIITNQYGAMAGIDKITTANVSTYIDNAAITNAQIGNVIQSSNYSAGVAGWKIDKSGSAEFRGNVTIGGKLTAAVRQFEAGNEWTLGFQANNTNTYLPAGNFTTNSSYSLSVTAGTKYLINVPTARWRYKLNWGLFTTVRYGHNPYHSQSGLVAYCATSSLGGYTPIAAIFVPFSDIYDIYRNGSFGTNESDYFFAPRYDDFYTNAELLGITRSFDAKDFLYRKFVVGTASSNTINISWRLLLLGYPNFEKARQRWISGHTTSNLHTAYSIPNIWKFYANRGSGSSNGDYIGADFDIVVDQYEGDAAPAQTTEKTGSSA